MKLTDEQYREILKRPAIARANSDALGGLGAAVGKQDPSAALGQDTPAQPRRRGRLGVVVTLIAFRRRLLDDDNNSFKHLRDNICRSLAIDDASSTIKFQYGQQHTTGAEGVLVRIEWV